MPDHSYEDVMKQINELASPSTPSGRFEPNLRDSSSYAAYVVEAFSQTMLEAAVSASDLRYLKDPNGLIMIRVGKDDHFSLEMWLASEGEQNSILAIRTVSDRSFPRSQLGRLLMLCNQWNRESRWPTAKVDFEDNSPRVYIGLEHHVSLNSGAHTQLVTEIVRCIGFGSYAFWDQLLDQLPPF
ncbi:MAG: YbjN domain-containing protein [Chloroflexota bacterium]|nr:YbjN domain-containing protein [Chloroflexota bacterium]